MLRCSASTNGDATALAAGCLYADKTNLNTSWAKNCNPLPSSVLIASGLNF